MRKVSSLVLLVTFNLIFSFFAGAKDVKFEGTVADSSTGDGIPGVAVFVQGTANGVISDINGDFQISVPEKTQVVFSCVGYTTKVVFVENDTKTKVFLEQNAEFLDEVVVTAMGVTKERKALGYSVTEVNGNEMIKARGGLNNPVNALQGKVAGLQISSGSGSMGGSSKILIRGVSSLSGSNQPLFVIDGVPIEGKDFNETETARGGGGYDYGNLVSDINPDDIQSISVLKGASASALYGSRANNGVVLITTKSGKAGKDEGYGISFTTSVGFEKVNKLPVLQTLYGGGYGSDFEQIEINGTTYNYPDYATDESWGPKYDGQTIVSWYDLAKWEAGGKVGNPTTSIWKAADNDYDTFFKTGISFSNNVSITKSTETTGVRISYTNTDYSGYLPNSKQQKNVLNLGGQVFSKDKKFEASSNITYTGTATTGRSEIGYGDNNVLVKFVQWGHRELDMKQLQDIYRFPDGSQVSWNRSSWDDPTPAYSNNPYWSRYMCYENDSRNRIYGNAGLSYSITPAIKVQFKSYLDFFVDKQFERNAVGSQEQSGYSETSRQQYEINNELTVTYNQTFGNVSVNALVGGNLMKRHYELLYGETVGGLAIAEFYNLKNSVSSPTSGNSQSNKSINSAFANATVGYKGIVYVDGTIRADQSSTLPSNNNVYIYPSVTGSFVFSELLKDQAPWVSFAKARVGLAKVGNDTDPYQVLSTYTQYTNVDPTTPGYRLPNTLNNVDLKPETTNSFEIGIEAAFFNGRAGFDVTYYNTVTKDQIIPLSLSGTTGYLYKVVNSGKIQNKGVEIEIHGTPVETRNFSWTTGVTFASNKNKVLELLDGVDYYKIVTAPFLAEIGARVGEPYGVIMTTNYTYDANGNKMIDPETGLYIPTSGNVNVGNIYPDFTGGWTNTFTYKNFDASVLIDFSRGGHYFSTSTLWGMYSGMFEESAANGIRENGILLDGVIDENGTKNTTVADGQTYCEDFYTGPGAQSVLKSDYIKLREVNIGYNLPVKGDKFIKGVKLSAYGRNLAIWGPDVKHLDPEVAVTSSGNIQGIEGGAVAGVATFGFSANIKF